ncbi:MAG: hypothetical protein ABSC94_13985 [Polyangiaceae bacterium]|jgi:hypothetical protein
MSIGQLSPISAGQTVTHVAGFYPDLRVHVVAKWAFVSREIRNSEGHKHFPKIE